MSALAERSNVAPFKASPAVEGQMRRCRQEDARLAAMLLLAEPWRAEGQSIHDFLMQIRFVKRPRVDGWLAQARVDNPRMPVDQLWREERTRLAGLLVRYSQEREA